MGNDVRCKHIVIIGGGPAGMMAAIRASQYKQQVTLIEKNSSLGKKLLLSGKGRCNLTNADDLDSFLMKFSKNGQFLRDAFKTFFNQGLMAFFQDRGLKLKIERQKRVFPVSDEAGTILDVLKKELDANKVKILYNSRLKHVVVENNEVKKILLSNEKAIDCDRLIMATGGISYSLTGSTGEGLKIAEGLGHKITELRPGLVGLKTKEQFVKGLQGLALKNIRIKFTDGKKQITSDIGELLFTDYGISGPLVILLSGDIIDWIAKGRDVFVDIDLKAAVAYEQLDARLLREFRESPSKALKNTLKGLLPVKLIDVFIHCAGIYGDKKAGQVTQDERVRIISLLKGFRLHITGSRGIEPAMVTRGGVFLKHINPRTMESRIVKGLYFAGEMIDVDAGTGGFNLQAAFSTGYLAGESAAGGA